MDDRLFTRIVGILLAALLVGFFTWWRIRAGRAAARKRLEELGATFHEGGAGLEVPSTKALISAPTTPEWSASLENRGRRFGVYPLKNGFLVLTWRSAAKVPLRWVMRSAPDVGNSRHSDLAPIDINGAFTYGAPAGEVETFLKGGGAKVFARFVSNAPGQGWEFHCHEGACYLTRYFVVAQMDTLLALADFLETELVAAHGS